MRFFNMDCFNKYFNMKYLLPILALLIYLSFPLYNSYTEKYIDNSLKKSLIIYASLKSLNSGISIIKESTIKVGIGVEGELAVGNIVSPIYDSIEKFSDLLTISIWMFSLEKIIYEISICKIFYIIVLFTSFLYFFKQYTFIKNILIILIFIRLFMPTSSLMSYYLDHKIFLPKMEKHIKIIKDISKHNNVSRSISNIIKSSNKNENFFENITKNFKEISSKIGNIKNYIFYYVSNFNTILNNLFFLSLLYFSQFIIEVILLPISIFYLIKKFL